MKNTIICLIIILALAVSGVVFAAPTSTIDLSGGWKIQTDPLDAGLQKGWQSPKFNDASWQAIRVPGEWENQGITQVNPQWQQADDINKPYTGYAWYRNTITIPADWKGRELVLNLGRVDDIDWTYLNGTLVGKTLGPGDKAASVVRKYPLSAGSVKFGQPNVISVRVLDKHGFGGIVAGPVSITSDGGDVIAIGGKGNYKDVERTKGDVIIQKGQTVKDAIAIAGKVVVFGHVTGDAVAISGDVDIRPGGRVDGDALSLGGTVQKSPGAFVGGDVTSMGIGDPLKSALTRAIDLDEKTGIFEKIPSYAANIILSLLYAFVAAIVVALFPARIESIAHAGLEQPGMSLLYGVIGLITIVPLALLLLVSCVGIMLIPVEAAIFFFIWLAGSFGIMLAIGRKIGDALNRPVHSAVLAVVIGSLILSLIKFIPFIGCLVVFSLTVLGFGAALMTGIGSNPNWLARRIHRGQTTTTPPQTGE